MIRHIVMWKFREGTEARAEEFLTGLAALQGKIVGGPSIEAAVAAPQDVDAPLLHISVSMAQRAVRISAQMAATARCRGSFL